MDQIEEVCKFVLCVLLTQLGKTFAAIERILTEISQDDEFGRSIHIVFTMNTLLNNKQFAKRLQMIEDKYGKGSICIVSSQVDKGKNKYTGKYKHVKSREELQGICFDKKTCPRVVVMCSNKQRFDDGVEFLKMINENKLHIQRAFAYYDELHQYICDVVRDQIEEIHALDITKGIIALTATADKIWKKTGFWSKIQLIYLDEFNETNYAGHKDMIFNCIDDFFKQPYLRPGPFEFALLDQENIGFIAHVLEKFPEILDDNTRSFIPAQKRRDGHNAVRDLIFAIKPNAVVVMINGPDKTIRFNEDGHPKTISLESAEEEVCETIARLVLKHGLRARPLVITGLLCVGMGQTLTHESLGSFTSAIFSHMDLTNDDIYQLFGRITGRMKGWATYVQTQVYCPTTIMHRCSVMEKCARNMAATHNGEMVSHEDYIAPMSEMGEEGQAAIENIRPVKEKKPKKKATAPAGPAIDKYRIYDTEEEAKEVCKLLGYKFLKTKTNENGFKETSLNGRTRVASLTEAVKKICSGYGGAKTGDNKAYRTYYPCYADTSDNTSIRYVVIIRADTDINKVKEEIDTIHAPLEITE